nr:hypothetical protein [Tanacetum cinerariifolium]
MSGGVTLLRISSIKHKERHLRMAAVGVWWCGCDDGGSGDDDVVVIYDVNGDRSQWSSRSWLDRAGGEGGVTAVGGRSLA